MEHRGTAGTFFGALVRSVWAYVAAASTVVTLILVPSKWYWTLPAGVALVVVVGAFRAVATIRNEYIQEINRLQEQIRRFERDELAGFELKCEVVGEPPEKQFIRLGARESVTVTQLDYLLADGARIRSEEMSLSGESVDVPIDDGHVLAVQLMPQPQKSNWDASAPIHFRLHYRVRGHEKTHTLPAWIRPVMVGNTQYRKVVG